MSEPKDQQKNEISDKTKAKKTAQTEGVAPKAANDKPAKAAKSAAAPKREKTGGKPGSTRPVLVKGTKFLKDEESNAGWRLIDATGQTLGRLSSYIAMALMGKDKPNYTPFSDQGDHVVVVNAEKVRLTGKKMDDKMYHYHTNYPGGIKSFTAKELLAKHPDWLIQWSVYGMLPKYKGHLTLHWYKKLRVFAGPNHPHTAQQPKAVKLPNLGAQQERA